MKKRSSISCANSNQSTETRRSWTLKEVDLELNKEMNQKTRTLETRRRARKNRSKCKTTAGRAQRSNTSMKKDPNQGKGQSAPGKKAKLTNHQLKEDGCWVTLRKKIKIWGHRLVKRRNPSKKSLTKTWSRHPLPSVKLALRKDRPLKRAMSLLKK